MNRKTQELAKQLYDNWNEEVWSYAPPGSRVETFEEAKKHWRRKAVKVKKTLAYRMGYHDTSP